MLFSIPVFNRMNLLPYENDRASFIGKNIVHFPTQRLDVTFLHLL